MTAMLQLNSKFHAGWFGQFQMPISCCTSNFWRSSHDKKVLHLLEICRTYYAVESGFAAMCVGHVVHAVCHTCQAHDSKLQTSYAPCPYCSHQHLSVDTTALLKTQHVKVVGKKVTGKQNATAPSTISPQASHHQPQFKSHEKGRESQAAKAKTEKRPPHKDLFIATMDCGTVGDMHPKEMIIDNISSQQCNEAYTVIKLPASASSKGTVSVHVKIDTRSGGNILPLHLFQQLHPKQTSLYGLPIGLDPIQTKLTAYNGSPIPLYRILCGPILWQPSTPRAQPHMIHSYWYIQIHLVLLSWVFQHARSWLWSKWTVLSWPFNPTEALPGTAPTQAARAAKPPAARTPKTKCIKFTDDLMREFPDRFTRIGKFLGEYKIWLHPDAHLVIHTPRNAQLHYIPRSRSTWQNWKPWK